MSDNPNMTENPLLFRPATPEDVPPFNRIEAAHFEPAVDAALERAYANLAEIRAVPVDEADFNNVIVPLETCSEMLERILRIFYGLMGAETNDELNALSEIFGPKQARLANDILLDPEIMARVERVHRHEDRSMLSTEQITLLEESYDSFRRGGAHLPEGKQAELREIDARLSTLSPKFQQNVLKATNAYEFWLSTDEEIAGLPDTALKAAQSAAQKHDASKGAYLFTLHQPSLVPFLTYAKRRDLREQMWRAFNDLGTEGETDNKPLILEIIGLRWRKAHLLGKADIATHILEKRMAGSPATVREFLAELQHYYKPAAEKDLADLQALAEELDNVDEIQPWDVMYYSEKLREKRFGFGEEELRPYFPLPHVLQGLFDHAARLFGLKFVRGEDYPVYHEEVEVYEIRAASDDSHLAVFYMDFHPRPGKRSGAWEMTYRSQGLQEGDIRRPVVSIVCNFTRSEGDAPALLNFDEVVTLFHEFGHALHDAMAEGTYPSLAGTGVRWDFVELPSQLMENWCYTDETLGFLSSHFQTGESLPADLRDKLRRSAAFMAGWRGLKQVSYATLDMDWHQTNPENIADVGSFEDRATESTRLFPRLAGPFSCHFGHIFAGGYTAGYYSYKWAEVLDADAFEAFMEEGLYNPETGKRFRDCILAKGGSEAPDKLYRDFRARDADPRALLRREGLIGNNDAAKAS